MIYLPTPLAGCILLQPQVYGDQRGCFFESFRKEEFQAQVGPVEFVQENESHSSQGVLRGLHYQIPPFAQAKLVRVVQGQVLDVVVDLRRSSPTYGQVHRQLLDEEKKLQMFIPRGFAHGFVVLSPKAIFQYKVDQTYHPEAEGGIRYDDPSLAIDWGLPTKDLIINPKDLNLGSLAQAFDFA